MPSTFNEFIGVGNVVRDLELRHVPGGKAVVKFRVAINPPRRDANKDETVYVDVTAWEALAERCEKLLKKGSSVLFAGPLAPLRMWKGRDGEPHATYDVVARTVQVNDRRAESGDSAVDAALPDEPAAPAALEEPGEPVASPPEKKPKKK